MSFVDISDYDLGTNSMEDWDDIDMERSVLSEYDDAYCTRTSDDGIYVFLAECGDLLGLPLGFLADFGVDLRRLSFCKCM